MKPPEPGLAPLTYRLHAVSADELDGVGPGELDAVGTGDPDAVGTGEVDAVGIGEPEATACGFGEPDWPLEAVGLWLQPWRTRRAMSPVRNVALSARIGSPPPWQSNRPLCTALTLWSRI